MKFSNKPLSQTIMQLCIEKGIEHIVISPGSRNAPLIISFVNHSYFSCYSIIDERSAAFFALGIAQQKRKPVVLVCTSGSALLNYYPAIAESFYSDIPLVVISADRPSELLEIGDGQTIRQENVYKNHILHFAQCKESTDFQSYNEDEINKALNCSIEMKGPVHINAPFSEPLYETSSAPDHLPKVNNPMIISENKPIELDDLTARWNRSKRKMILVGVLPPNEIEMKWLEEMAHDPSVLVFTETTSNLNHDSFFPSIDQMIAPLDDKGFIDLQPEILLTFGGMIVSKKIKAFLRKYPPKYHYHIDTKKAYDTFFVLKDHFKTNPNQFFNSFLPSVNKVESDYFKKWNAIRSHRLAQHEKYVDTIPFSDFLVFSKILKNLPNNYQVQLANSTAVRYSQLFNLDSSLRVFCNRGTSGIDGSLSTAIGAACATMEPTIFITGDLSFFYDSNGLWNNYIPKDFRIIILNNAGGGIFRILPGAKESSHFETYFETRHQLNAESLCRMYDLDYLSADDETSLQKGLKSLFESIKSPTVLEVFTPSELNDKVLLEYFEYIK
jgi:2-succinyl-5-enolpyruvyl-6-hydroxy-3-cyclohexene-1-carboxylate synthase